MYTVPHPWTSCYSIADSIIFCKETDINIRLTLPTGHHWSYDMSGATMPSGYWSFYDCILHELGHALLLNHINNPTDLMYYAYDSTQRKTITPAALLGAFNVVQTSASSSGYGCATPLVPGLIWCFFPGLGITNLSEPNKYQLNVYPNPVNDGEITIGYQLNDDASVQFKIMDYTGREIIVLKKENKDAGTYTENVDISALAKGIYLVMATINGQVQAIKIIKM